MASGTKPSRSHVKTGAHGDIERQLGARPLRESETPDDDFSLPAGYKNPYQEHREAQADERKAVRQAARTDPGKKAPVRPPSAPARPRATPSRSRTTSPSLSDPTGGRLPIGFDGDGIAGAFFGAVLYALILSVADYGAQGPLLWFKAKFLNQPAPAKGA